MLNKIKKPFFIFLFFSIGTPLSIFAQSYGTALGVRLADGFGFTLQQQVTVHTTVEVILQSGIKQKDVTLTAMGELHNSLLTRGFNFYVGGGLYNRWLEKNTNLIEQPTNPWGLAPIMGLELTMGNLNFSADFKPNVRLAGTGGDAFEWHTGISIRYKLAGRYFKDDSWKFWKNWFKKS
jgi:hypothetical protein